MFTVLGATRSASPPIRQRQKEEGFKLRGQELGVGVVEERRTWYLLG